MHILFTIREPGFYSAFLNELEKQSKLLVKRSKTSLLSFVTGRISGVFQENKACQIFWKTNISYPLICTRRFALLQSLKDPFCAYQGVRNICFFGKFGVLSFLETPVLRFALLPYYRRFIEFFSFCFYMKLQQHKGIKLTQILFWEKFYFVDFSGILGKK